MCNTSHKIFIRLFQCVQTLLEGERAMTYLTPEAKNELLLDAATQITSRYHELAAELISVVSLLSENFCLPKFPFDKCSWTYSV